MFRRTVDAIPVGVRRRVVGVLPSGLDQALRSRYYRPSLLRRGSRRVAAALLRRRHTALVAQPGVHIRPFRRGALLCLDIEDRSASAVRQHNLDLATGLLDQLDVDYFVLSYGRARRHAIAVAEPDRGRFFAALRAQLSDSPVYVDLVGTRGARPHLVADLPAQDHPVGAVTLGQLFCSETGDVVFDLAYGCQVQFWPVGTAGAWHAPVANRVTDVVRPADRVAAKLAFRGRTYRTIEAFAEPSLLDVRFPVDVVYTWVDGSDPVWRAKKDHYLRAAGMQPLADQATVARFMSRNELKYSLRSLHLYADWVRTVYLVTDEQVPDWLDTTHPKLRLVNHREIFGDVGLLPTFNSHAIESRLHHIDGLAEHYLYLNDDVFLGREVGPEVFFHGNGLSKFFLSKAQLELGDPDPREPSVMSAAKNNRRLLAGHADVQITQKFKHTAHPQQRSVLFELERTFPEAFAATASHRFRDPLDISVASALHHYYAYTVGRATPGEIRYTYSDNSDPLTPKRLQTLLAARDRDVICLNDTDLSDVDADQTAVQLVSFLEAYFPQPSPFEKAVVEQPQHHDDELVLARASTWGGPDEPTPGTTNPGAAP